MTIEAKKSPRKTIAQPSVEQQLYEDGSRFDFFQAVSLLEQASDAPAVGSGGRQPAARFTTPASTAFPASAIDSITKGDERDAPPRMAINFMGLTGPSGVLPRHYTELLIQIDRQVRSATKRTLAAWYDLFNNRFVGQLYRVWAKCRIDRGLARGAAERVEPDAYSRGLLSLVGLGQPALRNRLSIHDQNQLCDRVSDLALVRHAGTLARRQRSAAQVEALLSDYFRAPITIEPFRGQWLQLDPEERTRIGRGPRANQLGIDAVVGRRVWDRQSRVRVRVGPLSRERFEQFFPDDQPGPRRRRFIALCQLVRLAIGAEIDFDVQLVLQQDEVPRARLSRSSAPHRLGWDAWLAQRAVERDGDDPVFQPIETTQLAAPHLAPL